MISKMTKWFMSMLRLVFAKIRFGKKLILRHNGKPVYLGRGVRLVIGKNAELRLGSGCYIDDYSRIQVSDNAVMSLDDYVYLNTNNRFVASESIIVKKNCMFGPNVCVFDHDHIFDSKGVHPQRVSSPIQIGFNCWVAANTVITRGVTIADNTLIGGGSVVTRSLNNPGVYAGSPASFIHRIES